MLIIANGSIHVRPGEIHDGDLWIDGAAIVEPGGSPHGATVIDAAGASVVPLMVDTVFEGESPPPEGSFDLKPGNPATCAVIATPVSESAIRDMLVVDPAHLVAVIVEGRVVVRDGQPRTPAGEGLADDDPRLQPWTDPARDM